MVNKTEYKQQVELNVVCEKCFKVKPVKMSIEQYVRLKGGQELIQDILTDETHTAGERELIISHYCEPCYNSIFEGIE